jgi:hypothetical protein
MSRSRFWLIGASFALLVFALPLAAMNLTASQNLELRLIMTGSHVTILLVTDSSRTLITNSSDRAATRSAIGYLARPWEPGITTLVTPANDRAAIGLWEALRLPSVRQVVIIGLPGNDPLWSDIERECRERDIDLVYVGSPVTTNVDQMTLRMFPADVDQPGSMTVEYNGVVTAVALELTVPEISAHALIANRRPESNPVADLLVLPSTQLQAHQANAVYVREREVVVLRVTESAIAVSNGRFKAAATPAN